MPVYQYEGQHFDLPEGLSNEQAISKIETHLGKAPSSKAGASQIPGTAPESFYTPDKEVSPWEAYVGAHEAQLNVLSGMAAMPIGAAKALVQKAMNPSEVDWEKQTAKNMEELTYAPRGQTGRNLSELIGKGMNEAIPLMGIHGTMPAIRAGEAANAMRSKFAPKEASKGPNLAAAAEALTKPAETPVAPMMAPMIDPRTGLQLSKEAYAQALRERELQQQSAFNRPDELGQLEQQTPMGRMASELGAEKVVPEVAPDTSPMGRMAADLEAPPRGVVEMSDRETAGRAGEALSLDKQREAQVALENRQAALELETKQKTALEQAAAERARQENAPVYSKEHMAEVERIQKLSDAEFTKHQEQMAWEQRRADAMRENAKTAEQQAKAVEAQRALEDRQTALEFEVKRRGSLDFNAAERGRQEQGTIPVDAEKHPFVKAAEDRVTKAEQLLLKMTVAAEQGHPGMATRIVRAKKDLAGFEAAAAKARANAAKGRSPAMSGLLKKQGGRIRIDWSNKKEHNTLSKIAGIKERLGALMPDRRPVAQIIAEEAGKPDVQQNILQRIANYGTKGSLYQALKTDNPIIRKTGETMRNATNKAKALIVEQVHSKLAPAAQALSGKERTDIWAMQQVAESNGRVLTPEFLREHGFNEKQINWATTHAEVMRQSLDKMNEAMKATGQEPVSPRTAYLASRATGDFRRMIYKDVNGERTPISMLGANTRGLLDADLAKLKAAHPEYIIGEEKYFGGGAKRGASPDGLRNIIELLAQKDPNIKLLADHVSDLLTKDAADYMNAKSHTMAKKGILGMEGRKEFESADTNAKQGMQAQINYAEKIITWAEMAKAVEELKPLLKDENGLNMPNAKQWANDYVQQALGNNPSGVGRAIDSVFAEMGKATGIGPTVGGKAVAAAKKVVNGILLGFGNIGFIGMNMIQPFKSMPEMMALLKSRGLDKGWDAGTGYKYMAKASVAMWKDMSGSPKPKYLEDAFQYAKDNHVYSSDLFDSSNKVSKGVEHYWDKGTQMGASSVEMRTRQMAYLSYVELLHENGLTKADGLYETAHNLTEVQMNNYAMSEAPKGYSTLGSGVGSTAYNLMSYKHNEYSRLALLAREIGNNKNAMPLLTNLATSVAFAGVMGTVLYSEADELVKFVTKKMGKPTSLTKMLLDHPEIGETFKFGMGANVGLDLTSRMGTGPLVPQHPVDAVMPGAGKLVNIASAGYDLAKSPSEYNAKMLAREALPNSVAGVLDRAWFSPKNAAGEELSLNRTKVAANAVRNQQDKMWKTLGLTGINEAKQKSIDYENSSIDRVYGDIRKVAIDRAAKELFTSGRIPEDFAKKYIMAQGDPNSLEREITSMALEQRVPAHQLALMKNAMSNSLTSVHKTLRMVGKE